MNTLIAYASKYGSTKACVEKIAKRMPGSVHIIDVAQKESVDFSAYDTVILGTAVYMGKPMKEMKAFIKRNQKDLLNKKLGLFLCGIQDMDKQVSQQFEVSYPSDLRKHAAVLAMLGGTVAYAKLQKMDAFIMKMIASNLAKAEGVLSTISDERIDQLVQLMKEA